MDEAPKVEVLANKKCVACEGGVPPLTREEIGKYLPQVPEWTVSLDGKSIGREWKCRDFKTALEFTNKIGAIAEEEGHHPDVLLGWGKVCVTLTTHAIGGLSENDFILAAKIDALK